MHWSGIVARDRRAQADLTDIEAFIGGLYGTDLHAKRIASLAGATLGVMQAASLAVAMIGQAQARGLVTKQVDRLLSNEGIDVGLLRPLGAASDRRAPGPPCGDGLDRFRA
jgi:hypothetical protein